jgi:hypothetical protein
VTRRLLAAAALAVALTPLAADAQEFSVRNPVDGCTYRVWAPTYTIHPFPSFPLPFGITSTGGFGQSVECP